MTKIKLWFCGSTVYTSSSKKISYYRTNCWVVSPSLLPFSLPPCLPGAGLEGSCVAAAPLLVPLLIVGPTEEVVVQSTVVWDRQHLWAVTTPVWSHSIYISLLTHYQRNHEEQRHVPPIPTGVLNFTTFGEGAHRASYKLNGPQYCPHASSA